MNLAKEDKLYKTGAVPSGGGTAYKLKEDYYVFDNNSTTKSAECLQQIGKNHFAKEYDPRKLIGNIEANYKKMEFTKRTEYLKAGGTKVTYERTEKKKKEEENKK